MHTSLATLPAVAPRILLAVAALCGLAVTGCQVDVGGQTLPSAYYLQDDIQYFPAGPEFKLSKEAAAQKAYKKEIGADGCNGNCGGGCAAWGFLTGCTPPDREEPVGDTRRRRGIFATHERCLVGHAGIL